MAACLPTNDTVFHVCLFVWSNNFLVRRSNCSVKSSMVNDGVKENILVNVRVALHIHCFSNQVCIEYGLITIVKCECVLTCVEDGVSVSQSDGVTIFIAFPGGDAALCQSSPSWDRNLCVEVVVPYLWGHLKVRVVRVKVMVIIIEVIVRGQVFCQKILLCGIGS
jgi:hypothetical protein